MNHEPTTIRENEAAIAEHAYQEDYVKPRIPKRNGKKVAVVGAGPAGLSTATQLNQRGYEVTVFEARENAGGLLRFGIPNFKLNKDIIDRKMHILEAEGIHFVYHTMLVNNKQTDVDIQNDDTLSGAKKVTIEELSKQYDAVVVCTGTPQARDLPAPGRNLKGVYFALEMLAQQNRVLAGSEFDKAALVNARGKDVLVIGGGDTGSDCIGTSHRQGCKSVTQIEIMPRPADGPDDPQNPWPNWPRTLKTSFAHEEGCTRRWNINTLEFLGENGVLTGVKVQEIEWIPNPEGGRPLMKPAKEPEIIKADMVLLAMGFLPQHLPEYPENVFVAGDAATGASLVVRALASGRDAAANVDHYLHQ